MRGPQTFSRAPLGKNYFFYKMVRFGVLYKFLADGGAPNVAGPGVANPLPHPLGGPVHRPYMLGPTGITDRLFIRLPDKYPTHKNNVYFDD